MSIVTDVTVVLPVTSGRDVTDRFETLIEARCGYRPVPVESSGKAAGASTYVFGMNYAEPDLITALLAGPWPAGSVVFVDNELHNRPQVKVFGPAPTSGWEVKPEMSM